MIDLNKVPIIYLKVWTTIWGYFARNKEMVKKPSIFIMFFKPINGSFTVIPRKYRINGRHSKIQIANKNWISEIRGV